ncbi:MAG: O-antigen ligase family protein [Negativicutes bacterium]|nr:O-antigen ligase family protein [Negativicutes bacterium]
MNAVRSDKLTFILFCLLALSTCLSIAVTNFLLVLLFLLAVFDLHRLKTVIITDAHQGYGKVILLFSFTMLLSALFSGDLVTGLGQFFKMFVYRALPLVLLFFFRPSEKDTRILLGMLVLSFFISSVYVFYQGYVSGWSQRIAGPFGHPMTYAGFCCLFLPVLAVTLLDHRLKLPPFSKFLIPLCLFAGLAGLLLNQTRGAWLALLLVFAYVFFQSFQFNRKRAIYITTLLLLVIMAAFQTPTLQSRLGSITDKSMHGNERIILWESSLQMFNDHKIFGIGLGQFGKVYNDRSLGYKHPDAREQLNHAHNNFLHMLAENGIIGFIGFITMFAYFLQKSYKGVRYRHNPYSLMLLGMIGALLLQGFTEYNFGNSALMKTFWLLFGVLLFLETDWDSRSRLSDTKI